MTLFYNISNNKLFKDVLDKYFKGTFDNITLELLNKYDDIEISTTVDLEYIHKLLEETLKEHNDYVDDNLQISTLYVTKIKYYYQNANDGKIKNGPSATIELKKKYDLSL